MRIAIVDDWEARHTKIINLFKQVGITKDISQFRHPGQLSDGHVKELDLVCLDHDMCTSVDILSDDIIQTFECPNKDKSHGLNMLNPTCGCPTGRDTVEQLIKSNSKAAVWVHTSNHIGGPIMVKRLKESGFRAVWYPADESPNLVELLKELGH